MSNQISSQFCGIVGNNIKKYRTEKDLTLKELGEKVGLTEATVQKYEAGNIQRLDILKLKDFADALGVSVEDLTPWKNEASNYKAKPGQGLQEAKIVKMYSQLTSGHKKAVRSLMENLLECQEKYNSDK